MPTRIHHGDRIGRQGKLRVGSSAVIFDPSRERVLLVRRTDNGLWCLPGGGMDPGESITETCIREVLEETGLAVTVVHLIGVYTSPNWLIEYPDGRRVQSVALSFEVEVESGELTANNEVSDFGYFTMSEIENLDLMVHHRQRIQDAFEDRCDCIIR